MPPNDFVRPTRRAMLAGLPLAACGPTRLAPLPGPPRGRVLLLRGLANLFSTGLNVLTARLRAAGFDARVHSHVEWRRLADETVAAARAGTLERPFVVIGHSFGADEAISLAGRLGQAGVATDLLVTFDPQWQHAIPRGPRRVVNFHQENDPIRRAVRPGAGFDGSIENRLVEGESHLSIEKADRLHAQVLGLMEALAAQAPAAAASAPTPAPSARAAPGPAPPAGVPRAARLPVPPRPPVRAGG
jgi:thioesterase domain-containing protein